MSLGNASNGALVPVYKTDELKKWVEGGKGELQNLTEITLIILSVIGFLLFAAGVIQYMKEARNPEFGGGGADRAPAKWMMIAGGAFGSMASVFYFVVRVMTVG